MGCRGEININPRLLMGPETQIRGVALTAFWELTAKNDAMRQTIELLNQMAADGQLKPVMGKSYALDDVRGSVSLAIFNFLFLSRRDVGSTGRLYLNKRVLVYQKLNSNQCHRNFCRNI